MVPPFLHSLPAGSSINSHCCRLAGDERVSYIDRNKKRNSVNGPNFIAPTMKCCVGKATIVSRVPACRVLQPSDFFNLFNLFLLSLHHVPSLCLVSLYPLLRVWHSNLFSLLFMCTGCRVCLWITASSLLGLLLSWQSTCSQTLSGLLRLGLSDLTNLVAPSQACTWTCHLELFKNSMIGITEVGLFSVESDWSKANLLLT